MIGRVAADSDPSDGFVRIDSTGEVIVPGPLVQLLSADQNRSRMFRPPASQSIFDLTDSVGRGVITTVAAEHRRTSRPVRFRLQMFAADGHPVPIDGTTWWDASTDCWLVGELRTTSGYRQRHVSPPRLGIAPEAL